MTSIEMSGWQILARDGEEMKLLEKTGKTRVNYKSSSVIIVIAMHICT